MMTTPRVDTKQFNIFGHALPLLVDENSGKQLVKSSRKREDDIVKIDGKRRFHGAFTGGFSAGHWNTVGSSDGWTPQEFTSSRKEKKSSKRQRPQDFMDDDDFGEFGIAHRKIQARSDFSKAEMFGDQRVKDSENLQFTLGLGLAAVGRIISGSESNWGNKLLRKLGWKDGQGIGARKRAKGSELHGQLGKRIGPTMPSRDVLESFQPVTFAPKDCCPITFQQKGDNKGLGFKGTAAFGSEMRTNTKALSVTVDGKRMNITGQSFGIGALEEAGIEDSDIYAQDSMANYNFDLKTEKEVQLAKERAKIDEKNKFRSRYALKAPKVEGGHNEIMDGFVRGRPVKKTNKIKMPDIPRGYTGHHEFLHDCKSAIIIHACQQIARSVDDMASKYKVNIPSYVKGGKPQAISVEQRAHMLGEPAPNIKKEEPKPDINFACKWNNREKQERYDRYCKNVSDGKLNPYDGIEPEDSNKWEIDKERAEFERAATQRSAITEIMKNRFKRAQYKDNDENVSLAKTQRDKVNQEKKDAVKMNFFGAMTHECYNWYPAKLVCRRFNVPEPYPGSSQMGCPWLEAEAKKKDTEETVQDIFGATDREMHLFKAEEEGAKNDNEPKPEMDVDPSIPQISGGLASAAALMKIQENQFVTQGTAPIKPQKSLMELKRELVQKQVTKQDKKHFEINPVPVPGSSNSKLPATVKTVVREVNLNQQPKAMSKQPSRFSSFSKPQKTDSPDISAKKLRILQRQEKVAEKLDTIAPSERPPVDVFKSIFSDSESEEESKSDSSDDEAGEDQITIQKNGSCAPDAPGLSEPVLKIEKEEGAPTGPKSLQWNRRGQEPSRVTPVSTKTEVDDDDDMPKFVFTSKQNRTTTKAAKKENVKTEPDDDIGPALPGNFVTPLSREFPNLMDNRAQIISSGSEDESWEDSTRSKKKKSKKEKKSKKSKKEKKTKKSKR